MTQYQIFIDILGIGTALYMIPFLIRSGWNAAAPKQKHQVLNIDMRELRAEMIKKMSEELNKIKEEVKKPPEKHD